MPAGVARSPFIAPLATSLKMSPQSVRDRLNKGGYQSPYLDEGRALRILESQGLDLTKYRASRGLVRGKANGKGNGQHRDADMTMVVVSATAAQPAQLALPEVQTPTQNLPAVADPKQAAVAKMRLAWANKLIPRLARLLPEGDSLYGKTRARRILIAGGYVGPRWDDEARAIEIFRRNNIDVRNFEWKSTPTSAPSQTSLVASTPSEHSDAVLAAQAKRARIMLEQFERAWGVEWKEGRANGVPYPISIVFEALNELRAPARRKL